MYRLKNGYAAPHLQFEAGVCIIQELLGHTDVKTIMIYTHALNRSGLAVKSPWIKEAIYLDKNPRTSRSIAKTFRNVVKDIPISFLGLHDVFTDPS